MTGPSLKQWEQRFRSEAKRYRMVSLRKHARALKLRTSPQLLLEGTVEVVRACAAYNKIDGNSYPRFLAMQSYRPRRSPDSVYSLSDKQLAFESIQRLPEDASLDAIVEHLEFLAAVRKGLDQIERGQTIPHQEVKRQLTTWLGPRSDQMCQDMNRL